MSNKLLSEIHFHLSDKVNHINNQINLLDEERHFIRKIMIKIESESDLIPVSTDHYTHTQKI